MFSIFAWRRASGTGFSPGRKFFVSFKDTPLTRRKIKNPENKDFRGFF